MKRIELTNWQNLSRAFQRFLRGMGLVFLTLGTALSPAARATPSSDPQNSTDPDFDDVYDAAKQAFDLLAPADVKEQYYFPSREQYQAFTKALQAAMDGDSLEELAKHEPEARDALAALRSAPGFAGYADWLAPRVDEMMVARSIVETARTPRGPIAPSRPGSHGASAIPYYDLWLRRMRSRPVPANAPELMPRLRADFAAEGVPPELAWLAEVESSLNPDARNPSGAKGLYQLKSETAKGLGLSTFLPDERTDPDKSAHAAAHQLKILKRRFGSWPLAIAAYNAGEGRVSRALAARHTATFAGVASSLPAGTRMYVPEVCALVAVRTGRSVE